jgi:hypothetical protein
MHDPHIASEAGADLEILGGKFDEPPRCPNTAPARE